MLGISLSDGHVQKDASHSGVGQGCFDAKQEEAMPHPSFALASQAQKPLAACRTLNAAQAKTPREKNIEQRTSTFQGSAHGCCKAALLAASAPSPPLPPARTLTATAPKVRPRVLAHGHASGPHSPRALQAERASTGSLVNTSRTSDLLSQLHSTDSDMVRSIINMSLANRACIHVEHIYIYIYIYLFIYLLIY